MISNDYQATSNNSLRNIEMINNDYQATNGHFPLKWERDLRPLALVA
jgi:hypothetical protein